MEIVRYVVFGFMDDAYSIHRKIDADGIVELVEELYETVLAKVAGVKPVGGRAKVGTCMR